MEKRGFRVWYDNRRAADHRNLEGMKRGVRESEVFLIFLSGRKETSGQPDLNGEYEGPFTRWFCQEEMTAAHEAGLRCVGVKEDDERFGKPDFALEKSRSSSGKDGGPIHERAAMNARILDEICFIDFRRQQHEMKGMIDEVVRQRTCAPVLGYTEEGVPPQDFEPEPEPEPEVEGSPRPKPKREWQQDEDVPQCSTCGRAFGVFLRRHHCRMCGRVFCANCSPGKREFTTDAGMAWLRVARSVFRSNEPRVLCIAHAFDASPTTLARAQARSQRSEALTRACRRCTVGYLPPGRVSSTHVR